MARAAWALIGQNSKHLSEKSSLALSIARQVAKKHPASKTDFPTKQVQTPEFLPKTMFL